MTPYVLLMLLPALLALFTDRRGNAWLVLGVGLVYFLFIGFRNEVGPDWYGYLNILDVHKTMTLGDVWSSAEPLFGTLALIGNETGAGIYLLNIATAGLFCVGLFAFARSTGATWIAIAAATSYLVLALAMSGIRQAAAMGIVMLVLANWTRWSVWLKLAFVAIAAMFHFSALLWIAFILLFSPELQRWRWIGIAVGGVIGAGLIATMDQVDVYVERYWGENERTEASGALYHTLLNAVPATIYLLFYRHWREKFGANALLTAMAVASLLVVPFMVVSSVGASRLAMYFTPAALMIWAGLPRLLGANGAIGFWTAIVVLVQVVVMVVWLTYANVAELYFPYQNILFGA